MESNYDEFGADYFVTRNLNDPLRLKSFEIERKYIVEHFGENILKHGNVLDVGCSTGEFLEVVNWNNNGRYGIEISEHAKKIAKSRDIKFDNIHKKDFYDLIIFRGTIQYLKDPFLFLEEAVNWLKPGGGMIFLATPNANSIYYRTFRTLPFLEENLNFYIPTDVALSMNLKNLGLTIKNISYPYLLSPYSNLIRDHFLFILKYIFRSKKIKFPFWKSMIHVVAQKI